jgi:hypothetical protein
VKRRALLILPLAALGRATVAPAAAGQTRGVRVESSPVERFRFHAGAPLLAPAGAGSDGSTCVGTSDGYVHLLGPDGSFRWSRSVEGPVIRRPILAGSLWFVVTSAERIDALTADGMRYWVFRPPSPVASELAVDAAGIAYFVAADHCLYGVTAHGGVCLRVALGVLKAGPSSSPDGAVWAENQAGNRLRVRGQALRRVAPAAAPEFDFGCSDALRDPNGHEWRVRVDGVLEFRHAPDSPPSIIQLTRAPLLSPSWLSAEQCALISARDGLVVAFAARDQASR